MARYPILPTLHSSVGYLTQPQDILTYVLRQVTANPGSTSTMNESEMVSLRKLEGTYGDDPQLLGNVFCQAVQQILVRYFPEDHINVSAAVTTVTDATYTLDIRASITDKQGTTYALSAADLQITKDHKFLITFKGV